MDTLHTIVIFVAALIVLVGVHEFGHFAVARCCGIQVLRFSIGFGPALLSWRDRRGTRYMLAAIPLGGYVHMLDEREGEVPAELLHMTYNRQPVLQRMAVLLAGPLANLLLAVLVYWCVFLAGERGVVPIIGTVAENSVAELAGLEPGQEIVAVDGHETPTWQAVNFHLLKRIGDSGPMTFAVRYPGSDVVYRSETVLDRWLSDSSAPAVIHDLGITIHRPPQPPLLDQVQPDNPAAASGLRGGDLIVSADGTPMNRWDEWVAHVRARPQQAIELVYERAGTQHQTTLTPRRVDGGNYGYAGVTVRQTEWPPELRREYHYGPLEALQAASRRSWELIVFTLHAIKKLVTGLISPSNLGGPITIARVASDSAQSGLASFATFLALLSISLGVINLLPVPLLDGGRLLYCLIEWLSGRPLPIKLQTMADRAGLLVIFGVMMLALYNDVIQL